MILTPGEILLLVIGFVAIILFIFRESGISMMGDAVKSITAYTIFLFLLAVIIQIGTKR